MKKYFKLLLLSFIVKMRNFIEYLRVIFFYYRKLSFAKIDFSLLILYFFQNPFKMSKLFLLRKGEEEVDVYGETPLTTLDQIAHTCQIQPIDKVFELGCGRGRSCFWLNSFIGCKVEGIEFVPAFVHKANQIKKIYNVKNVNFLQADILEADFEGGTFFYLYGTCYDTPFIEALIVKFRTCLPGIQILTVSYQLNDYCDKSYFNLTKKFSAVFTWGKADVYLQSLK